MSGEVEDVTASAPDANAGTAIPGEIVPGSDAELASFEERARRLGWKDKHEFDRPPERWVDAKTFIERGETALPVLRENLHRIEGMLGASEARNRDLGAQVAALNASVDHLRELALNADRAAFDRAKREFEGQKRYLEAAIANGAAKADVDTVRRATEALTQLREPAPPKAVPTPTTMPGVPGAAATPPPTAPSVNPVEAAAVQAFVAGEKWFRSRERDAAGVGDMEATEFATSRYSTIQRTRPDLTPAEQLAEVKRSVQRRFPELFENPARAAAGAVAAPNGGTGSAPRRADSERRWEDIPAADRAIAEKTIADVNKGRKDGKTFSKADYAAMYWKGQS